MDRLDSGLWNCICVGIRQRRGADAWRLKSVTYGDGDLAWLSFELASAINEDWYFTSVAITTRMPRIGEELTIAGFRFDAAGDAPDPMSFPPLEGKMIAAAGTVQEVYLNRRDTVLVSFPSIEIACGSVGSMSGGAVLDSHGLLVGVLSTGFNTDANDGPSNAAWIIHALALRPEVRWPPNVYPLGAAVLELPDALCHIVGREAMPLLPNGGVDYKPW